jgi:hypothetical protein
MKHDDTIGEGIPEAEADMYRRDVVKQVCQASLVLIPFSHCLGLQKAGLRLSSDAHRRLV